MNLQPRGVRWTRRESRNTDRTVLAHIVLGSVLALSSGCAASSPVAGAKEPVRWLSDGEARRLVGGDNNTLWCNISSNTACTGSEFLCTWGGGNNACVGAIGPFKCNSKVRYLDPQECFNAPAPGACTSTSQVEVLCRWQWECWCAPPANGQRTCSILVKRQAGCNQLTTDKVHCNYQVCPPRPKKLGSIPPCYASCWGCCTCTCFWDPCSCCYTYCSCCCCGC
jgi:hypothetical protein